MAILKRLKREIVAKGHILDYCNDTLLLPDGKEAVWDLLDHKGAAAIVPVLDDGRIVMVRQYRNTVERETLEIPAGGLNGRDEPTLEAAIRELSEETGFISEDLELLFKFVPAIAYSNEVIDIYVAHNLKPGKQHLDEDEYVEYEAYEVQELIDMILGGKIVDSKTIAAILAYKEKYLK